MRWPQWSGSTLDATYSVSDELDLYLRRLLEDGSALLGEYEFADATPGELGLVVVGDLVKLPRDVERLHAPLIEGALSVRAKDWLIDLEVALAIDSTNVRMVEHAQSESVAGQVLLAELQTAGRGRRGRRWFSPFARNLAVTLGVGLSSQPEVFGQQHLCRQHGSHCSHVGSTTASRPRRPDQRRQLSTERQEKGRRPHAGQQRGA